MKKNLISARIVIILTLCFVCSLSVSGEENADIVDFQSDSIRYENELIEIKTMLSKNNTFSSVEKDKIVYDYDNAYKCFEFQDVNIISQFKKTQSFEALISDNYSWKIPTANEVYTIKENNNEWEIIGFNETGTGINAEKIDFNFLKTAASKSFKSNEKLDYKIVKSNKYHTTFIFIKSQNNEIIIASGSRPDLTGLENGRIYSANEAIQILSKSFNEEYRPYQDGGVGIKNSLFKPGFLIPLTIVLIGLCVATVIFIKKRLTPR